MYTFTSDNDNTDGCETMKGEYDRIYYLHFEDGTTLILNAEPIYRILAELDKHTAELDK
jgi:hypothetical protein